VAHEVFISHAQRDKPVADAVCATLEREGIRCWIAPRDIQPGMDWSGALIEGLRASKVLVLLFSKAANTSQQVLREVERAIHLGIAVLPVRIEDVMPTGGLEYHLGTVHWLDAMTPPLEAHLKRLTDTVKAILRKDDGPAVLLESPLPSPPLPPPAGHSGRGIASFVTAVASGLFMFITLAVAGALETASPTGLDEDSGEAMFIGLLIFLFLATSLVALGLGISGLMQRGRKTVFATLGTVIASLTVAGTLLILLIGTGIE
jgi:hypothetical protein